MKRKKHKRNLTVNNLEYDKVLMWIRSYVRDVIKRRIDNSERNMYFSISAINVRKDISAKVVIGK